MENPGSKNPSPQPAAASQPINIVTTNQNVQPAPPSNPLDVKWYEKLLILPALILFAVLIIGGGIIGGLFGLVGLFSSLAIIRRQSPIKVVRLLLVIGVLLGCLLGYFVSATLLRGVIDQAFRK